MPTQQELALAFGSPVALEPGVLSVDINEVPPSVESVLGFCFPEQRAAIRYFIDPSGAVDKYAVCSAFHLPIRRVLYSNLQSANPNVRNAFLACAEALCYLNTTTKPHDIQPTLWRATSALTALRSMEVHDKGEATLCVCIAVGVVTFATSFFGADCQPVLKHSLELIRPHLEDLVNSEHDTLAFVVCLTITEICGSLLRTTAPTIRLSIPFEGYVDRYLGLSCGLLPHLYDLAEVNNALMLADESDIDDILLALAETEQNIREWCLPKSPNLTTECGEFNANGQMSNS